MTGLVVFNHVDGCFEALFVHRWWEGGRVIETNEDANVEEVFFCDAEVGHDVSFGDVIESWFRPQKVD